MNEGDEWKRGDVDDMIIFGNESKPTMTDTDTANNTF